MLLSSVQMSDNKQNLFTPPLVIYLFPTIIRQLTERFQYRSKTEYYTTNLYSALLLKHYKYTVLSVSCDDIKKSVYEGPSP